MIDRMHFLVLKLQKAERNRVVYGNTFLNMIDKKSSVRKVRNKNLKRLSRTFGNSIKSYLIRPELDAENVNEHLDIFVNSILASINQSIPDLLEQISQVELIHASIY